MREIIDARLPKIWYGGDHSPDQWPESLWPEDMRLFNLAGVDVVTLPVFSWALLQPEEERYEFGWLDRYLDMMAENGLYACLATSTGAHPAWMARRYPDVLRVDFHGRKRRFGARHNSCPSSPTYRYYAPRLAGKLAERYKDHPALLIWHVSNEYGGSCYCEGCAQAFRVWLQKRFGSLEAVNERWNTRFWGHTFYDWDEIVPPNALSEHLSDHVPTMTAFQGISLDYSRFMSDKLLECFLLEREAIRAHTPHIPVTTNMMGTYKELNYFEWAKHVDIVSWDNYPSSKDDAANIALRHDLMRGLRGGQPFLLLEQTPSQQNWKPYNELKRPGVMRLWSYQAVARGADSIMFFQLRQSRGACEKFHGALISHAGHENTRVYQECKALGEELKELGDAVLGGRTACEAAIVFDWENWWALEFSSGPSVAHKYLPQIEKYYRAFWRRNTSVDLIHPDMDLARYKLVVAPAAYLLQPGFASRAEAFVEAGGVFLTTFFSGIVDESDRVVLGGYPGELRKVLGIWVEETDALFPEMKNAIVIDGEPAALRGRHECGLLCDLLHLETAEAVGVYAEDFYAGRPALTRNRFGSGWAWYVATDPDQTFVDALIDWLCAQEGIEPVLKTPAGVEAARRSNSRGSYIFLLNHNAEPAAVDLGPEAHASLLENGRSVEGKIELPPYGVMILREPAGS